MSQASPAAKRPKVNPTKKKDLDVWGSTNMLPKLTQVEKANAEAQLALPVENRDVKTFFHATKILLRHEVMENKRSVEWLRNNFTYLNDVSTNTRI